MPSAQHETPIALVRHDPGLIGSLLTELFDVTVPPYATARPHAADVPILTPRTYHADAMLVYADAQDRPVFAVVLEIQRRWDPGKQRTWQLYLEQGRSEGEAKGEAKALLAVLEARGLDVPAQLREQIMGTTDTELLDTWLRAAVTATSLGDLTWARGS